MPKINVYLPEDLAEEVKAAGIPVSPVCQAALQAEVRRVRALAEAQVDPTMIEEARARLRPQLEAQDREAHAQGMRWALLHAEMDDFAYLLKMDDFDDYPIRLSPLKAESELGNVQLPCIQPDPEDEHSYDMVLSREHGGRSLVQGVRDAFDLVTGDHP